jgi:hypothetical protein
MLVMEGGAPANVAGGASIHADETAQKPLARLGIKQAMASLYFAPQEEHECNDSIQEETIQWEQTAKVIIKDEFAFINRDYYLARAAKARTTSAEKGPVIIKDKSVIVTDCSASSTLTGSLINTTGVGERIIIIETADGKESTIVWSLTMFETEWES